MITKNLRLPISDFPKKGSRSFHYPSIVLKLAPNQLSHNRFGVIISSKVEPKSTRRHALKRRTLAALKTWPILKKDILVIIQKPPSSNFDELENSFKKILSQIQNG